MKLDKRFIGTAQTRTTSRLSSYRAQTPDINIVQQQLKTKIDTFIKFDAHSYLRNRRPSKKQKKQQTSQNQSQNVLFALLQLANQMKRKQQRAQRNHKKPTSPHPITQTQRIRFQKMRNPLQFLEIYKQANIFTPKQHQQTLLNKLIKIKVLIQSMQTINLDRVLQQIYQFLNMTVDCNQFKLLIVTIILIANVCYQAKDYKRAIFFYNQARIASIYSGFNQITIQSLIGMSRITYDLQLSTASIKILKKALAYAWKKGDHNNQTQIYDLLGQNYCIQGKMQKANYYHQRYIQNYIEKQNSAVRKIYLQIIKDDIKNCNLRLYSENIDLLFLETVNLPIYNFHVIPAMEVDGVVFDNYIDGQSPRKSITKGIIKYEQIQDAQLQIKAILQQSDFIKQMPNPDVQTLYAPSNRYGKPHRQIQFSHTLQFHAITNTKLQTKPPNINKKYSLQKQIELVLEDKPVPNWYQQMSKRIRRQRLQKLGSLKDPIRKSHMKVDKRKRSLSTQSQNIRSSINKAILSWIDPLD